MQILPSVFLSASLTFLVSSHIEEASQWRALFSGVLCYKPKWRLMGLTDSRSIYVVPQEIL